MMTSYLIILALSFGIAVTGVPLVRRLALAIDFVDTPGGRKTHRVPVPLLGGVAVWLAALVAVIALTDRFNIPQLGWILLGATIVATTGVVDDRIGLSPWVKLACQALAVLPLIAGGVRVESVTPYQTINLALTVLWVVGITNAFNLLDNMDGMASSVAAIAAGFFLVLAAASGQFLVASLSAALAGSLIGFLRYNFVGPARIFLGDSGALFIGFMLATLGIKLRFDNLPTVTWIIPILVLGIPIFDTTLVSISRLRRGKNPLTTPGSDHFSHRLVLAGLSRREAVLVIDIIGVALGLAAVYLSAAGTTEALVIGGIVAAGALYGLVRLESIYRRPEQNPTVPSALEVP